MGDGPRILEQRGVSRETPRFNPEIGSKISLEKNLQKILQHVSRKLRAGGRGGTSPKKGGVGVIVFFYIYAVHD